MRRLLLMLVFLGLVAGGWVYLNADPQRSTPSTSEPAVTFIGSPAVPRPIDKALSAPLIQHPFLAPAGMNSMHNDAAQSDVYRWGGPLGKDMEISTRQFHRVLGSCVAQAFTGDGLMVGTCVTPFGVTLVARDPESLTVLARKTITRWLPIGQKFSGGVYFHLDNEDRVLLATNKLAVQVWALRERSGNYEWALAKELPVGDVLDSARNETHHIIDVMPDWDGNYWFITRSGIVGAVDRDGKNGSAISLEGEGIDNALAVGEHGVFVVSNHAMYNFDRSKDGEITAQWRETYDRGSAPKEGTMGFGAGTTPTLIGNDYVAITDNADGQINVMVYAQQPREGSQVICAQPIFPPDRGTTENSLAAVGNSLIAENNFGYSGPRNTPSSEAGIARVDVLGEPAGCQLAWETYKITSPSAVPKVSLANGLIYLYTRDESNPEDMHAWYFTAIDFATGELAFKQLTGTGWLFNNHYGSISIAPDGSAYVGMMGGLVKLRDRN